MYQFTTTCRTNQNNTHLFLHTAQGDAGQWQRGKAPPPMGGRDGGGGVGAGNSREPPRMGGGGTMVGNSRGATAILHKTDNKWQAGKAITDDPEEEKKQKAMKGMLNKLTIENFEKLSQQVGHEGSG